MDDRYEYQKKLQELTIRAGISFKDFKSCHLVSFMTLYDFIKKPELAKNRTLFSVSLICEFLEAACNARLLPVAGVFPKERPAIVNSLYNRWWDNGKKFHTEEPSMESLDSILGAPQE